MLIYYKLSGVNAVVALIFNLVILLGLMAYIGAVMTLPGIAGFVLTMGIGVDSNVLIFERIKEELEAQRGVRASINAGFSRVFWTLVDTHIAALISAAFLFQFGTGPIRGFAVTLVIGLMSNLFTSIFVSKTLFELALSQPAAGRDAVHLSHAYLQKHPLRLPALALARDRRCRGSSSSPASSSFATKGIPRGIEFAGGTVGDRAVRAAGRRCSRCATRSTSNFPGGGQNVDRAGLRRSGAAPGDDPRAAGRRRSRARR